MELEKGVIIGDGNRLGSQIDATTLVGSLGKFPTMSIFYVNF
jgi:hypothetical protein